MSKKLVLALVLSILAMIMTISVDARQIQEKPPNKRRTQLLEDDEIEQMEQFYEEFIQPLNQHGRTVSQFDAATTHNELQSSDPRSIHSDLIDITHKAKELATKTIHEITAKRKRSRAGQKQKFDDSVNVVGFF